MALTRDVRRRAIGLVSAAVSVAGVAGWMSGEVGRAWDSSWPGTLAAAGIGVSVGFIAGMAYEWVFDSTVHFSTMSDRQIRILSDLYAGREVVEVFDHEVIGLWELGLVKDSLYGDVNPSEFAHRLSMTAKGREAIQSQPISWMLAERRVSGK